MSINIASRDTGCTGVVTMASQAFVEKLTLRGIEKVFCPVLVIHFSTRRAFPRTGMVSFIQPDTRE